MEIIASLIVFYVLYRIVKWLFSHKKALEDPEFIVRVEMGGARGSRSSYDQYDRPKGKTAKWYSGGESVRVQGYKIPDGLVYVGGNLPDSNGYENDACLINPKLKVIPGEPWEAGEEMGYWPKYGRIPAKCRGAYLKWLVGKRSEPEANIGYVFLFFYGLERRLFIEGQKGNVSEKERLEIITEVRGLLENYGSNRSFRGYASNFLAMEWVLYQSERPVPEYIAFNDRYCSEPFQVVLAKYVAAGNPIPGNVALQWIILHPEFGLGTPARRCEKEFRLLFAHRYAEKFGDGLIVKPNKTPLKIEYRAANPSIQGNLKLNIPNLPNPFILTGPLKRLNALAEECTVELESYSRHIGRKENRPQSLAALALLPKDLLSQVTGAKKLKADLEHDSAEGPRLMAFEVLYDNLGEKSPSQLSKREAESLAVFLEKLGFGLIPDIRCYNLKPNPDGNVVIFPKGHGVDFRPSKEFRAVGTILRLGAMVSQIDQDLSPHEEALLQSLIQDNRELTAIEKNSLMAFLYWCLRTPQATTGIKQRLADMSTSERTAISHILISVAQADGRIDPKEVKQLEKLYSTLGLDKEQVASDLHSLALLNEPVTVDRRDPETTFTIPPSPIKAGPTKGFRLNEELIRIREEETRWVKGVLEKIFSDQVEDEIVISATTEASTATSSSLDSLSEAHQKLLHRLLKQESWERSSLHEICKELGLMVDGAMEVLNEWSFEQANVPLIDDGEPVYVDVNLGREIING